MIKLPFSAVVVSHNEGYLLEDCLLSLGFCDEIIVVDMGSTDDTKAIAMRLATRIIDHPKVDVVEMVHVNVVKEIRNDWLLCTDPDERIDPSLVEDLHTLLPTLTDKVAAIRVPIHYYFAGKMLKGTFWGGYDKLGRLLFHKERVEINDHVHAGKRVKSGFETVSIQRKGNNIIHHYWMQSYRQLIEKHKRYLQNEGKSSYHGGLRYTMKRHIRETLNAFKYCFWDTKGYKDGFTGLFLSFFWAWYIFGKWASLQKYESQLANGLIERTT